MGVATKRRRKINVDGNQYVWYVAPDDDSAYNVLNIVSEDKSYVLAVPLQAPTDYIISKGRVFQGKKTNGTWERYKLPISVPDTITPGFVAQIIKWAVNGESAEKQAGTENRFPYETIKIL